MVDTARLNGLFVLFRTPRVPPLWVDGEELPKLKTSSTSFMKYMPLAKGILVLRKPYSRSRKDL